jgi:predicted small integral membrane protein
METATEDRRERALRAFLAGLQAGMLGAICLLAWLGASALRTGQGFWAAANLMASVFHGAEAIRSGFSASTLSGVALYLLLYSLLGALFAMAFQSRMSRPRLTLVSILFTIFWYYLSFGVLWKIAAPLVARLHYARATLWGHLIYGAMLSRYPVYLAGPAARNAAEEPPTPPPPR